MFCAVPLPQEALRRLQTARKEASAGRVAAELSSRLAEAETDTTTALAKAERENGGVYLQVHSNEPSHILRTSTSDRARIHLPEVCRDLPDCSCTDSAAGASLRRMSHTMQPARRATGKRPPQCRTVPSAQRRRRDACPHRRAACGDPHPMARRAGCMALADYAAYCAVSR